MTELKSCPVCGEIPQSSMDADGCWILQCEKDGHMAMGQSLSGVRDNWNTYIGLLYAN